MQRLRGIDVLDRVELSSNVGQPPAALLKRRNAAEFGE
jgi:hypothetical protein